MLPSIATLAPSRPHLSPTWSSNGCFAGILPASSSVAPTATSSSSTFAPKPTPRPRLPRPNGLTWNPRPPNLSSPNPSAVEVELKLRLPDAAAHRRLSSFLAPRFVHTEVHRNLFFDASSRPLAAASAALRIRLYGPEDHAPSCAIVVLKRRTRIDAGGVCRVEESYWEDLDTALALACVHDPARLGSVDSDIIRLVSRECGVGGHSTPFVSLGGYRNTRHVYELEEGEGLGLVLELDETQFDFGSTNYELECETAEPDLAKEVLQRLLTAAGVPYEYSRSNKFACVTAGKLLP